ncbi:MAG: exodeoxyribonuclease VII large subunit [Candidatus Omnitrophica bacterium]|nr:exodeoxyribonuclease VII large subunit [Candidatus Omnitrophota bacterium]
MSSVKPQNKNPQLHLYTVSELTQDIKLILENTIPLVWVEGEISNFTHHLSGHMYFSLKDENAVISACLFKNVNQGIKFKLAAGMRVICLGRITVYGKRGQYQIVIEKIEPKGIGSLQLAFQQLKEKLFKEGLFDEKKKKPIPIMPFSVGIATSSTGAAIRDILKILKTEAGFLRVILRPTLVQGEGARDDIVKAILEFNSLPEKVDVLIIGRGGGSMEDLWAFNEEVVARAISVSSIPVISAVGHEIDTTISDLVADLRAETPTAAAKIIVSKKTEILRLLQRDSLLITGFIKEKISNLKDELNAFIARPAFRHPLQKIEELQQDIDGYARSAYVAIHNFTKIMEERLAAAIGKFHALNPISILARGFSLTTTSGGEIIKEASSLKQGDTVRTRLAKGSFQSKVVKIDDR